MGSIQQLEKLHRLLATFQNTTDSLEKTVACERIKEIIYKTDEVIQLRSKLREDRRQLRFLADEVEKLKLMTSQLNDENWITEGNRPCNDSDKRIKISIGGMLFECLKIHLLRDPQSLLAQLCEYDESNTSINLNDDNGINMEGINNQYMSRHYSQKTRDVYIKTPEGYYYFDRDWWLFRHILNFLRDGSIPEDRTLLSQLYKEASVWKLKSLQHAIEEDKLHLHGYHISTADRPEDHHPAAVTVEPRMEEQQQYDEWWKQYPSWWRERGPTTTNINNNNDNNNIPHSSSSQHIPENEYITHHASHGDTKLIPPLSAYDDIHVDRYRINSYISNKVKPTSSSVSAVKNNANSIIRDGRDNSKEDWWTSNTYKGRTYVVPTITPNASSTDIHKNNSNHVLNITSTKMNRDVMTSAGKELVDKEITVPLQVKATWSVPTLHHIPNTAREGYYTGRR